MNVLDENISEESRQTLLTRRIPVRQIGKDLGREGMKDPQIIPYLLTLSRPTFFTLDLDYYKRRLCHPRYCLVYLDVKEKDAVGSIVRILRHPAFRTWAERRGAVVRVSPNGFTLWRVHAAREVQLSWGKGQSRRGAPECDPKDGN